MRTIFLLALAAALASCDAANPEPAICLLGPETEVDGDVSVQITSPASGDTLRVGQAFRFRAEVEARGDVRAVGLALVDGNQDLLADRSLFERALDARVGRYVVDEEIVLDSLRAGADRSNVYVAGTGRYLINTACGGALGGAGTSLVRVTVLD